MKPLNLTRSHPLLIGLTSLAVASAIAAAWATDASRHTRNRFYVRQDSEVSKIETPPHDGTGKSTAYRYFDDVPDARVIFRKRTLHKGASIGMHVLEHDEVYYVVSGRGVVTVDDTRREVGPATAIFMHEGADVGIQQTGTQDFEIIVSYPPASSASDKR